MVLIFIFAYANRQADRTQDGAGKLVDVMLTDSETEQTSTLLGTTGQFIFLYDSPTKRVVIHPIESIHSIAFQAD